MLPILSYKLSVYAENDMSPKASKYEQCSLVTQFDLLPAHGS